ncbi:hypothetical protein [Halalkalicoccus subterraneus]|nr:hypothetical protein [Halalkalicoccus subterraneus]
MKSTENAEPVSSGGIGERWARLDRGWRAVALGLAVVGLQWLRQII